MSIDHLPMHSGIEQIEKPTTLRKKIRGFRQENCARACGFGLLEEWDEDVSMTFSPGVHTVECSHQIWTTFWNPCSCRLILHMAIMAYVVSHGISVYNHTDFMPFLYHTYLNQTGTCVHSSRMYLPLSFHIRIITPGYTYIHILHIEIPIPIYVKNS